jgi:hypothetical protein
MEKGYRHVRVQLAISGMATYGARGDREVPPETGTVGPTTPGRVWEPAKYVRDVPRLFEHLRAKVGDDVELLHDIHVCSRPCRGTRRQSWASRATCSRAVRRWRCYSAERGTSTAGIST